MRGDYDLNVTGEGPNNDATRMFGESVGDARNRPQSESSLYDLTYEDLDFGPSDDEVRATLQPGKRGTRKLYFSNVFGDDAAGVEVADDSMASFGAGREDETKVMKLDAIGTDPEHATDRSPSLIPGRNAFAEQGVYQASDAKDEWEVGGYGGAGESGGAGCGDGSGESASRMEGKSASKVRFIVAGTAVFAVVAVAFVFFLGGFGPGYWNERVELGMVDFVDWRTGNPVRPSEELVFEKGDKREYFAPNVAGYRAIEARANDRRFKLVGGDGGKDEGGANIIVGLSPWPDSEKSQITVLYAKEVEYTVNYVEAESNVELAPSKVVKSNVSGDEVTERAVDVEGYELVSDAEYKLTLLDDNEKNTITFEYRKVGAENNASSSNGSKAREAGRSVPDNTDAESQVSEEGASASTRQSNSESGSSVSATVGSPNALGDKGSGASEEGSSSSAVDESAGSAEAGSDVSSRDESGGTVEERAAGTTAAESSGSSEGTTSEPATEVSSQTDDQAAAQTQVDVQVQPDTQTQVDIQNPQEMWTQAGAADGARAQVQDEASSGEGDASALPAAEGQAA